MEEFIRKLIKFIFKIYLILFIGLFLYELWDYVSPARPDSFKIYYLPHMDTYASIRKMSMCTKDQDFRKHIIEVAFADSVPLLTSDSTLFLDKLHVVCDDDWTSFFAIRDSCDTLFYADLPIYHRIVSRISKRPSKMIEDTWDIIKVSHGNRSWESNEGYHTYFVSQRYGEIFLEALTEGENVELVGSYY